MARPIEEVEEGKVAAALAGAGGARDPFVVRGLAAALPVVQAGRDGAEALLAYLFERACDAAVPVIAAPPETRGRFGYDPSLSGANFQRGEWPFPALLARLGRALASDDDGSVIAAQGVRAGQVVRGFGEENALAALPPGGEYRLWLGGAGQVAAHADPTPNLAFVAAGRRRFTLFAPEQVANLYLGPFQPTPNGVQISLADPLAPDLDRFPRFGAAMEAARTADLAPGDAIFIPAGWFHHVEARERLNLLVNYWWPVQPPGPSPWDAMLHGLLALRGLPHAERRFWRAMFDHYVFEENGDPVAHLPAERHGALAPPTPERQEAMRLALIRALGGMP